ncbi:luciferin 4-monooxygenase-like [Contarinia nasturtii]|uniref:luciferin 4-monooxygenase-like n=1 Tax=Contarinia nasturtii TaxID=265458 RepID=UPI0012D4448F|nr:luciferin 4-monooxygenase-like [Contarinia nasturtii]XP_031637199.1 luciferin 4-monooxygenase-like [Contarinia nasturtii]
MYCSTRFDEMNKVWYGPSTEYTIDKQKNFGEIILEKLSTDANRAMQIDGITGETLTKAEVRQRTIRCAQNLVKFGYTKNDSITIVARNHHNLTPLLFGAICCGIPISPLDVLIVEDGISTILQRLRPAIIFCDADVLRSIQDTIDGIGLSAKIFTVNKSVDGYDSIDSLMVATDKEDSFVCATIDDAVSHIALIACSSGSTGLPKSICWTHASFIHSFLPYSNTEVRTFRCLNFSSFYWFSSIWSTLSSTLCSIRVFSSQPFSTDLFFDLVEKYKVQKFLGPPCQFQAFIKSKRCKNANLSTLLVCIIAGSSIPPVLLENLTQIIPKCLLMTGYGMTEMGGISFTTPRELKECPNSAGQLLQGAQIKIISDTGDKCGIDEHGEIYVKMPIPSMGYYNDEIATQNAFDSEGYFITGDLGYFNAGRLFIIGRKKEIFKNRGFAVWPIELENLILKHPAIKEATVVCVYDDDIMTDLPAAVVIKQDGFSITENEVSTMISDKLANYKHLEGGVYFVDELPVTPSGKIIRPKIKDIAQNLYERKTQPGAPTSKQL